MKDKAKTSAQSPVPSIDELSRLRRRVTKLERDLEKAKAEKNTLREKEAQFQRIVSNITDVIVYEVDQHGVVLYFSMIGENVWGYNQEDVVGKNFIEFVHPDDVALLTQRFLELSDGMEYPLTYRMRDKSGNYRWVRTNTKARTSDGVFMGASGTLVDVTDQKQIAEALRESEDLFRSLVDYMHDAMIILSWDGAILFANRAAARIIEYERAEQFIGHNIIEYIQVDSLPRAAEDLDAVKTGRMGFLSEYQLTTVTGRPIWVESIGGKILFRRATANLVCIRDITERRLADEALRESEKKYRELSIVDDLTQLYNSRHFYFQLKSELDRANRYEQPLTLLLLDLDNFKEFNDAYGHVEGDQVLRRLGQVVKTCLRETDFAYRYGGEEFTILLPMTTSADGAVTAERIRTELKKENFSPVPGQDVHLTVSIGIAQYRPQEEMKAFVRRVDQLMYQVKRNGKDRVCCEA